MLRFASLTHSSFIWFVICASSSGQWTFEKCRMLRMLLKGNIDKLWVSIFSYEQMFFIGRAPLCFVWGLMEYICYCYTFSKTCYLPCHSMGLSVLFWMIYGCVIVDDIRFDIEFKINLLFIYSMAGYSFFVRKKMAYYSKALFGSWQKKVISFLK